jgi:hypothetical protein
VEFDVSQHIRNMATMVEAICSRHKKVTLTQLVELYRGSASKALDKFRSGAPLPHFGDGKGELSKADAERAVHIAIRDGVLDELLESNDYYGGVNSYVFVPGNWRAKLGQNYRAVIRIRKDVAVSKKKSVKASDVHPVLKATHKKKEENVVLFVLTFCLFAGTTGGAAQDALDRSEFCRSDNGRSGFGNVQTASHNCGGACQNWRNRRGQGEKAEGVHRCGEGVHGRVWH